MANPQVYVWPVAAATAIAAVQSRTGAGKLLLNGTLAVSTNNGLFVDLGGVNRVLTLTSVNDLHLINVTITGTLNGVTVTETRSGPTSNTVATTQVFSTITSITTSGTVTAMSVGTGTTGYTNWYFFDYNASVANLAISVDATATVSYSFQVTLDDVQTVASPLTFTPITAMTTASTDQLANYTAPFTYCRVAMISSDATGAMTVTLVQQGLHS
jgi:hypothetical protein